MDRQTATEALKERLTEYVESITRDYFYNMKIKLIDL